HVPQKRVGEITSSRARRYRARGRYGVAGHEFKFTENGRLDRRTRSTRSGLHLAPSRLSQTTPRGVVLCCKRRDRREALRNPGTHKRREERRPVATARRGA